MIGERLKKLRTLNSYQTKDMADLLGVSQRTYQSYERGQRDPSTVTLSKIAVCFGVSADYLIGVSDVPYVTTEKHTIKDVEELRQKVLQSVTAIKSEHTLQQIADYIEYLAYKETKSKKEVL